MSNKRKRKPQAENVLDQNNLNAPQSRTSRSRPDDFNPDYTYVVQDLRTIGILAGIFITILVILSFII
ncbi:MAG: hypothetical protein JJE12_03965 [Anaerolineales bacterium]|nr:hypothetical protein [Anaerolineales bacterium]